MRCSNVHDLMIPTNLGGLRFCTPQATTLKPCLSLSIHHWWSILRDQRVKSISNHFSYFLQMAKEILDLFCDTQYPHKIITMWNEVYCTRTIQHPAVYTNPRCNAHERSWHIVAPRAYHYRRSIYWNCIAWLADI